MAGRYEIEDVIASGGMGTVYRARHVSGRHRVALKVIPFDSLSDPAAATRFTREVTAAESIGHEGIVRVLDAGVDEPQRIAFVAMELLEGETLAVRIARLETSRADALRFVHRGLAPLAAAHAKGFVHRDVKPDNFFVARLGEREVVKLLDFGLARHVAAALVTQANVRLGTPGFMSPEQAMGLPSLGPAADVFAVGVMLYVALAQRLPFPGPSPAQQIAQIAREAHVPLVSLGYAIPEPLSKLVDRCLAKDPRARPRDAAELRAALGAAMLACGIDPEAPPSPLGKHAKAVPPPKAPEVAPTQSMDVLPTPAAEPARPGRVGGVRAWQALALVLVLGGLVLATVHLLRPSSPASDVGAARDAGPGDASVEDAAVVDAGAERDAAAVDAGRATGGGTPSRATSAARGASTAPSSAPSVCAGRWEGEAFGDEGEVSVTLAIRPIAADGSCGTMVLDGLGSASLRRCRPGGGGLSAFASMRGAPALVHFQCPPKEGAGYLRVGFPSDETMVSGTLYR
ncbi:MAG: protein kinase [Polyangiales bacterium]